MPQCITAALHVVGVLLGYGRHLLATVRHRAAAPTFPAIAACFGTSNISTILAHLNRGILRAAALERVLLACAANGRDNDGVVPAARTAKTPPAPADIQAEPLSAHAARPRQSAPRPSHPANSDDPELFMPTPEDLERQVRRRALGRTIGEICLDLAVVPGFCTSSFWNDVFTIMWQYGGNVSALMQQKARRREAFIQEQDKKLGSSWDWLQLKRDQLRQVLGFFIGEPPVDPFDQSSAPSVPVAAAATGPP